MCGQHMPRPGRPNPHRGPTLMKPNWCVCQVSSDSGYVSYRIPAEREGSHAVRLAAVAPVAAPEGLACGQEPLGLSPVGQIPNRPPPPLHPRLHSRRGAACKARERSFISSAKLHVICVCSRSPAPPQVGRHSILIARALGPQSLGTAGPGATLSSGVTPCPLSTRPRVAG